MGKYTDRMGERLRDQQQTSTIRMIVRIVFLVLIVVLALWVLRRVLA